ncbi:MAG: ankyrin repeat domain-containing protein [Alphaproteobacteria bacterium]|nr:ankyrin repeat domain-containing protein [Alphaproteobacteria bacterium]
MAKNKKGKNKSQKKTQKKVVTLFERLCQAFEAGNLKEAKSIYSSKNFSQFSQEELKEAVQRAIKKGNYAFLENFQGFLVENDRSELAHVVKETILTSRQDDTDCSFGAAFRAGNLEKAKKCYRKYNVSYRLFDSYLSDLLVIGKSTKKGYKFLEDFCLYLRDYGKEEDATVLVSLMAHKDEKYLEWAKEQGIKVDWYIFKRYDYNLGTLSNIGREDARLYLKEEDYLPLFREGNLEDVKSALKYISPYEMGSSISAAITNGQYEFLEELCLYLKDQAEEYRTLGKSEKARDCQEMVLRIATELVKVDREKYGPWTRENGLGVRYGQVYRSVSNQEAITLEELQKYYLDNKENITFEDFKSKMNRVNYWGFTSEAPRCWAGILQDISGNTEKINNFFKPLCDYLIRTNQTELLETIFDTAVKNGYIDCASIAFDTGKGTPLITLIEKGYSADLIERICALDEAGEKNIKFDCTDDKKRSPAMHVIMKLREELRNFQRNIAFDYTKKEKKLFGSETLKKLYFLINHESNLNSLDVSGYCILDYLLKENIFLTNSVYDDKQFEQWCVSQDEWVECIEAVLEDPNLEIDLDSKTPYLIRAIELRSQNPKYASVVLKLIEKEPYLIFQKDANGKDAFQLAVELGDVELLSSLLKKIKEDGLKFRYTKNERVALLLSAASHKDEKGLKCVQALVSSGFDINEMTEYGQTPLHRAILNKNIVALEQLLRYGADDSIKTKNGRTVDALMASFPEGKKKLDEIRAKRNRIMIVDKDDLKDFVSYATEAQFLKFKEDYCSDESKKFKPEELLQVAMDTGRVDLIRLLPEADTSSVTSSGRTLFEEAAGNQNTFDGVRVITGENTQTQGTQGVVRQNYEYFEQLKKAIETFDLEAFNALIYKMPPEVLLMYNSQGVNLIAFAEEQSQMLATLWAKQSVNTGIRWRQDDLTDKEKEIIASGRLNEYLVNMGKMQLQLRRRLGYYIPSNGKIPPVRFIDCLPVEYHPQIIRIQKALEEKDVDALCKVIMERKYLPDYSQRLQVMELLIQNKKAKELKTLLEFAREEGELEYFIEPFESKYPRKSEGRRSLIHGKGYSADVSEVLDEYTQIVNDGKKGYKFISYESEATFVAGGQFPNYSQIDEMYFYTIAKRILPPEGGDGYASNYRKNVANAFLKSNFIKKHPEALELYLKLAKDRGCFDEVMALINPGPKESQKNFPEAYAAIQNARNYVPVEEQIKKAANEQNVDELVRLILEEPERPSKADRAKIEATLQEEDMRSPWASYHKLEFEHVIKTEPIFPKKEDRFKVMQLLIENGKTEALEALLQRAKEEGILGEFLYAQPDASRTEVPSALTPIELALKSNNEEIRKLFSSIVLGTKYDFLMDQKPYEDMVRNAIENKNADVIVALMRKDKYLPAEHLRYDAMALLIEKKDKKAIEDFLALIMPEEKRKEFLNTPNEKGVTLLMLAAKAGNTKVYDLLLENGADASLQDKEGKTVLDYAKIQAMKNHLNKDCPSQTRSVAQRLESSAQDITSMTDSASLAFKDSATKRSHSMG